MAIVLPVVLALGAFFFYRVVLAAVAKDQRRTERENRDLRALRSAWLDVASDLSLDSVLQKVVDLSRKLIGTRYGALAVMSENGEIETFITSGISEVERRRVGDPPRGRGLLGVVLNDGERLRLESVTADPRSAGFPPHHPAMDSLLAIPVVCQPPFRGNLYLSEKLDGSPFDGEDEEVLVHFARHAAIAIDNAHSHRRAQDLAISEERLRISREMHDGVAQVLAYCNTKLQAIREFLESDRGDEAKRQLDELAATSRSIYADVREGILGLRTVRTPQQPFAEALQEYFELWQDQSGITGELTIEEHLDLDPAQELQLVRIVQEALSNIRKHSRAERAQVSLMQRNARLLLHVEDDGIGFDPSTMGRSQFPRFGLTTMKERADSICATMKVDSQPGAGTRIHLELPTQVQGL